MIDSTKIIEHAKTSLGAPLVGIEITDEQMASLLKDAQDEFYLYAEVSDMSEKEYYRIQDSWIKKYFYALCKETLGRIRSKISIVGIDNSKLDAEVLLQESEREKNFLKYLIFKDKEFIKNLDMQIAILVFYINVGNHTPQEVGHFMADVKNNIGEISGFKIFFLPIQGESRVECLHPSIENNENGKDVINRLNEYLDKLTSEKGSLIGGKIILDLGAIGPSELTIVEIDKTLNKVFLRYDSGKTIDLTISNFEELSNIKI